MHQQKGCGGRSQPGRCGRGGGGGAAVRQIDWQSDNPGQPPSKLAHKKMDLAQWQSLSKQERQKLINDPEEIICDPKTISRALQFNSEALLYQTERPNLALKSPVVKASF